MKIGAIIQARMGSTRLPSKVMKKIKDKSVLEHVVNRVIQSTYLNEIIIATTVNEEDGKIEKEALKIGTKVFRGSQEDVLSRYYLAAKEYGLDIIVRITSDCPLYDPNVLDEMIKFYLENEYEVVSNASSDLSKRTYPRGLDTEIFSFEILENAYKNAEEKYQREHVTPYIYENTDQVFYYKNNVDYSKYRWTLDTDEDFKLISEVYKHLYNGIHDFYFNDIVELFERIPDLYEINAHIEQKKIK